MEEIKKVANGSPPEIAISHRDWSATIQLDSFTESLLHRSYVLARSLLDYRFGNFLVDIRDSISSDTARMRHKGRIIMDGFSFFFDSTLKDHFPEPPNLNTLKFEQTSCPRETTSTPNDSSPTPS